MPTFSPSALEDEEELELLLLLLLLVELSLAFVLSRRKIKGPGYCCGSSFAVPLAQRKRVALELPLSMAVVVLI